jgi:hypothetical protein
MIDIDIDRAKALVQECIAERGAEYKYEKEDASCKYVHGVEQVWNDELEEYEDESFDSATPGCLVGAALHKAGIELFNLGTSDRNDDGSYDLIEKLTSEGLVTVSQEANNFLGNCQASQDAGAPWGRSAEEAARGMQLENTYDESGHKTGEFVARQGAIVA